MAGTSGDYSVQYYVNINTSEAIAQIEKFTEAARGLNAIQASINKVAKSFNTIGAAYGKLQSKEITLKIDTKLAKENLNAVLSQLQAIKAEANVVMNLSSKGVRKGTAAVTNGGQDSFFGYSTPGKAATGLNKFNAEAKAASKNIQTIFSPAKLDQAGKPLYKQWEGASKAYQRFAQTVKDSKLRLDINTEPAAAKIKELTIQVRELKTLLKEPMAMMGPSGGGGTRKLSAGREAIAMGSGMAIGEKMMLPKNASYRVLGPSMIDSGGGGAMNFVKGMGIMYGITGLGQAIGGALNQAVDYDNIMQTVKNILGAHDKSASFENRFADMTRTVRQVNTETKFTTPQVADATKFLAMAGLNLDQINKSIRPITDLALIGDTDLGTTADVTTNIMTGYKIPAGQMRRAADIMTNTFTESNTTLMDVAEAFKYSSSLLHKGGIKFEEAAGAIGILGDAGIKGSHAGTTIRTLLANLVNPTKQQRKAWDEIGVQRFDKSGNLRPLLDIFGDLHKLNLPVDYFYRMFRMTAAQGAAALATDVDKWNHIVQDNFLSHGMVKKLADAKKNTIQGLWAQLTSMFAEDGIRAFEGLQKPIRDFLSNIISWLKTPEFGNMFKTIGKDVFDLLKIFLDLTQKLIKIYNVFRPIIKEWLKWQIYLSMILIPLRTFRGLINFGSMLGRGALQLAALGASFRNLGGSIMFANTKMSLFGGKKYQAVLPPVTGLGTALPKTSNTFGFTPGVYAGPQNNFNVIPKKVPGILSRITPGAKNMGMGIGTMALGAAGGYGGYKLGEKIGGDSGGMIGSIVGSLGGMAFASALPSLISSLSTLGLGASLGIGGVALGGLALLLKHQKDMKDAINESAKSNEAWAESLKSAGIASRDMSQANARIIANLDIYNNKLSTSNEKMQQSIDLYAKMWADSRAPMPKTDTSSVYSETDEGKWIKKEVGNYGSSFWTSKTQRMKALRSLGLTGGNNVYDFYGYKIKSDNDKVVAAQTLLAKMGRDDNNEQLMSLKQFMSDTALRAKNFRDYNNYLKIARSRYVIEKWANKWNDADLSDLEGMSLGDIHHTKAYATTYNAQVAKVIQSYSDYAQILRYRDKYGVGSTPQSYINQLVRSRVSGIFASNADPGSLEFYKHIQSLYRTHPVAMVKDMIADDYNNLQTLMTQVPTDVGGKMKGILEMTASIMKMSVSDIDNIVSKAGASLMSMQDSIATTLMKVSDYIKSLGFNVNIPTLPFDSGNSLGKASSFSTGGSKLGFHKLGNSFKSANPFSHTSSGKIGNHVSLGSHVSLGNTLGNSVPLSVDYSKWTPKESTATNPKYSNHNGTGTGKNGNENGGAKASDYANHYKNNSAAPKQVIVNIGSLMDIKSIDMSKKDNQVVVGKVKEELAQALIDVVHDFDATWNEND